MQSFSSHWPLLLAYRYVACSTLHSFVSGVHLGFCFAYKKYDLNKKENVLQGELYAGGLFMTELLGWNVYAATIFILLITAVYTIAGRSIQ